MNDLYYIDTLHHVIRVPYSRDRAMSVKPMFYHDRREALEVAVRRLKRQIDRLTSQREAVEEELLSDTWGESQAA